MTAYNNPQESQQIGPYGMTDGYEEECVAVFQC